MLVLAREGGLPGTLRGSNQAFCSAGRSQDLVKHSNESQSSAPDKAKTRLLGTMLSTVVIKKVSFRGMSQIFLQQQAKGEEKKNLAIKGSKWYETGGGCAFALTVAATGRSCMSLQWEAHTAGGTALLHAGSGSRRPTICWAAGTGA